MRKWRARTERWSPIEDDSGNGFVTTSQIKINAEPTRAQNLYNNHCTAVEASNTI